MTNEKTKPKRTAKPKPSRKKSPTAAPPRPNYPVSVSNCTFVGHQKNEHDVSIFMELARSFEAEAKAASERAKALNSLCECLKGSGVTIDSCLKIGTP